MNIEKLEEAIERELERWKVPALEVVAVQDGEVVLAKGYGRRNVERNLPATPKTLFHHGSTGKAFTSFLIGTLVDDGLVEWDRPVRDYLPEFRVSDPIASDRITVRDLLSHRTGLPRHEWAWIANPSLRRAELVKRVRHLELSRDLRAQWQYSNLAYTTAGYLAGVVAGSTWEEQMKKRVFEPLGMALTVTAVREFEAAEDHAHAYLEREGEVVEVPIRIIDNAAPAGQIISCAEEMALWLLVHTSGGEIDGRRVISEAALKETHTQQMSMGNLLDDPNLPGVKFYGYCMGWLVGTFRGQEWLWHNGGIDGYRTEMGIVPSARTAVSVCANLHMSALAFILLAQILEELIGLEPRPWADETFERVEKALVTQREAAEKRKAERQVHETKPAHALEDYAGSYEHPGYGRLEVAAEGEELRVKLGELDVGATYRHFETWDLRYEPLDAGWPLSFVTGLDGNVTEAAIKLDPNVDAIRFRRSEPKE